MRHAVPDDEQSARLGVRRRWWAWRSHRRAVRNQQLLDTSTGTRMISASLTTLDAERPGPEAQLRVW
jgi:hypothetical protein